MVASKMAEKDTDSFWGRTIRSNKSRKERDLGAEKE